MRFSWFECAEVSVEVEFDVRRLGFSSEISWVVCVEISPEVEFDARRSIFSGCLSWLGLAELSVEVNVFKWEHVTCLREDVAGSRETLTSVGLPSRMRLSRVECAGLVVKVEGRRSRIVFFGMRLTWLKWFEVKLQVEVDVAGRAFEGAWKVRFVGLEGERKRQQREEGAWQQPWHLVHSNCAWENT